MPQATVDALVGAGLHAVMMPRAVGGLEAPLVEAIDVFAEIARADGSTGWCVFIAGCNPLMGAFLPASAAAEVFGQDPQVAVAGVVLPYGKAVARSGPGLGIADVVLQEMVRLQAGGK